jgi:recombination protein RecT
METTPTTTNQTSGALDVFTPVRERCVQLFGTEERFVREATLLLQILHDKPELQAATRQSIVAAMLRIASTGLTVNPVAKECYVITRNTKVRQPDGTDRWEKRLAIEPSYIGLMRLATDTGAVVSFETQVVWQGDQFDFDLSQKKPSVHKPYWVVGNERGELRGVYGFVTLRDGTIQPEQMGADEIDLIKSKSESVKSQRKAIGEGKAAAPTVYDEWLGEMARKALVKRLQKWVPRSQSSLPFLNAIDIDNEGFDLAPSREPLAILKRRVIDALERYNGLDKDDIREMCQAKAVAGEFTEEFAFHILKTLER